MLNRKISGVAESGRRSFSGFGFVFVFLAFLLYGSVPSAVAQQDPLRAAAESFLALLDAGSFQQAWREGSELLHLTTTLEPWADEKRVQRDLLGRLQERSVRTVVRRETLAGFPDGVYGVLVTECRFEKKQRGVELISLGKDPSGGWRVIAYDLR